MFQAEDFPKVSIVIPVYNGTNFLQCAIDCALNQTYQNIEVLVINDGSKDDGATERVALSYGDKIRYFHKENGGVSSALNYGIRMMTGDYMAWLSHDDGYSATRIEDAVNLLRAHELIGKKCIGYTGGFISNAVGKKMRNMQNPFEVDRLYSGYEVVNLMTVHGTLYGCSFLFPREVFDEVGGFDESLRYSQDSLMWYRIFLAGYSLVSDKLPNVMSRVHGAQVSHTRRDLFAHDALVIAKLLAEPLAQADGTGELLHKYTKRLTKYECTEAVRYLCRYATENGYMGMWKRLDICLHAVFGFFRHKLALMEKKVMLAFRR